MDEPKKGLSDEENRQRAFAEDGFKKRERKWLKDMADKEDECESVTAGTHKTTDAVRILLKRELAKAKKVIEAIPVNEPWLCRCQDGSCYYCLAEEFRKGKGQ